MRPALDPDIRERQMVNLAEQLAEKQLREGTASSQVITHYLKLATEKERTEREILKLQKDLITAKTEAIKSQKKVEEMYAEALTAMRSYSGQGEPDEY